MKIAGTVFAALLVFIFFPRAVAKPIKKQIETTYGVEDVAFRESVGTFRRMTLAESQAAKPLHIKIVTVASGDTVERLASRMAMPDRAVERFRVLNGLGPNERVNPGDQVKLVVE